jgi:hypothetical protein
MLQKAVSLLLLGLMLTFGTPANAANATGHIQVYGFGTQSCGAYSQARQQPAAWDAGDFTSWLGGYISATNHRLLNTYDVAGHTDFKGLLGWLDNYCRANPTENFAGAAEALVIFLYPTRKKSADK